MGPTSQPSPRRHTTTRDRHRSVIARGKPPCALCGEEIDYSRPHMDPREFVVDHIIPLAKGGTDTLTNKQPAHRACNRAKGARVDGGPVIRRSGSLTRPTEARGTPPPPVPTRPYAA